MLLGRFGSSGLQSQLLQQSPKKERALAEFLSPLATELSLVIHIALPIGIVSRKLMP